MIRPQEIRLSKYLADCGIWSRRKCEDLITSGRIKVDGRKISDLAFKVSTPSKVLLDEKLVEPQEKIVIALNKPPGYISTASDEFDRKTVLDLVKSIKSRLYPAGRLDRDSRGLIILTNDGELVYNITHPRFMVPKTYQITVSRNISKKDLSALMNGINIDSRKLKPDRVKIVKTAASSQIIEVQIHEGRKRILRRVMTHLGYEVLDLKRIKIGGLSLGDLKEGRYRVLKKCDIQKIFTTPGGNNKL
ncbi:pseudouridine synthase [Actinomycetota bacterium]